MVVVTGRGGVRSKKRRRVPLTNRKTFSHSSWLQSALTASLQPLCAVSVRRLLPVEPHLHPRRSDLIYRINTLDCVSYTYRLIPLLPIKPQIRAYFVVMSPLRICGTRIISLSG